VPEPEAPEAPVEPEAPDGAEDAGVADQLTVTCAPLIDTVALPPLLLARCTVTLTVALPPLLSCPEAGLRATLPEDADADQGTEPPEAVRVNVPLDPWPRTRLDGLTVNRAVALVLAGGPG
jgi:hypothetical protein